LVLLRSKSGIFTDMRRVLLTKPVLLMVFFTISGAVSAWNLDTADQVSRLLGESDYFAAAIVQGDRVVPVAGGRIEIDRRPFAVVIVTHEPAGLLVNASREPALHDGIRAGRSLPEILPEPEMFMGMAEYLFNPDRELFVTSASPHYFFFASYDQHRYDFVHLAPGAVIGYRTVEYLRDLDEGGRYSVETWSGPLYLSFLFTRFDDGVRVELQRTTTLINFRG
jgi:hypothetical protein